MIRIGTWRISGGFLVLIAWINYLDQQKILPMVLLACAMHELGHIAVIQWNKIDIKQINITAIGAEIITSPSKGYCQDGVTALAGPGINLLLALVFGRVHWGAMFSGVNLVLACFNLLPIGALDGGRALRATLSLMLDADTARSIGTCIDWFLIGFVLLAGIFLLFSSGNITLLLIGGWMLSTAVQTKEGK